MIIAPPWATTTDGISITAGTYADTDLLRIPYVSGDMPYLNQGSSVFWKLLQMLPQGESVDQPRFEYFTDTKFETQTTANGIQAADAGTVVTTDKIAIPNSILYNVTSGEYLYVTAVAADGVTCTVVNDWAGSGDPGIGDLDSLILLGSQLPEGADANLGIAKLPTKDYNYVSFFSETLSETDVQKMANMRANVGKIASSYTDVYNKVIEQIDNILRFGTRFIDDTVAGGRVYFTGGFRETVGSANNVDAASYANLSSAWTPLFRHSSSSPTKIMLCGEGAHDQLITLQGSRINESPTKWNPEIGAYITRIRLSSGGVLDVVLDQQGFHTNRGLENDYFIVDPMWIKRRAYKGFEDIVTRDVTAPQSHTMKDELFGSAGLETLFPADVHAWGTISTT